MPPTPCILLRRRADGARAGALYDLPHQRQVCLHAEDEELTRFLVEHGVLAPRRPPFLDAGDHGVHGAYASRPQVNWFLAPPIEAVTAALEDALRAAGGAYELVPA